MCPVIIVLLNKSFSLSLESLVCAFSASLQTSAAS